MSGGRWDYGRYFEDNNDALGRLTAGNLVLQAIEHELDWGLSGDTCRECAKLRAVAALEQFFDDRGSNAEAAVAIARDHKQNRCAKCFESAENCPHNELIGGVSKYKNHCLFCGEDMGGVK
jgi:polyferredoxin